MKNKIRDQGKKNFSQRHRVHREYKDVKLLFLVLSIFLSVQLFSQETTLQSDQTRNVMRISQDEAVEMAVKNNLSLEASRTSLSTKKRASNLSWNQFLPELMVAGSLIVNNEREEIMAPVPLPGMGGLNGVVPIDGPKWNFAIPIQASLTISIAMFENMNRLKLDYEAGLIAYDKAKLQLERDIRKSYNNMLLLQENIALLREHFNAADRRVQMAAANFRAGRAPELTWLQAQVGREIMRPMIDQAENGLRLSMASFAMFLGLDYDTQFELIPYEQSVLDRPIPESVSFDVSELITKAASGKPDIQELRHNILMLQSVRKAQSKANLPFLNVSWDFTPVYVSEPLEDWRRTGALSVTLGWKLHSLLPFSKDSQGVKSIDDQITTANIGLAQMIQGTEIEVYNIILSLEKIRSTAEAHARTITLANRTYQSTLQAFQQGAQDLLQVQNAELELRQARVQMLEQQFNYLNGLLDLEYAIGVPFGTMTSQSR